MVEGKAYKTKLCVLYKRGHCPRHNCSFAHGSAELRHYSGRRDFRGDDLRDKLDKRLSPRRTFSPRRDARGKRPFNETSPTRSLDKSSGRKHRKRHHFDGQSDFSGSFRTSEGPDDQVRERSISDTRLALEKKLKDVQSDINVLDHRKGQLRALMDAKSDEAVALNSRVQELGAFLSKESEECRRLNSKIKKFVKAHRTYTRVDDELRRSQVRLQKLGEQLVSGASSMIGPDDSSIIDNDGEKLSFHALNQHNSGPSNTLFAIKMLRSEDTSERLTQASLRSGDKYQDDNIRVPKHSGGNLYPPKSLTEREYEHVDNHNESNKYIGSGAKHKRGNVSLGSLHADKQLKASGSSVIVPATGMAAHAIDESAAEEGADLVNAFASAPSADLTAQQITGSPGRAQPPSISKKSFVQNADENSEANLLEDLVDVDIV